MANEVKLRLAIEGGQTVTATIDGVTSHIDKLDARARDAATGATNLKDALGRIGGTGAGINSEITSIGAKLAGLAASFATVISIGGKLVSVQREFDVLNSSLTTVTGSSAKAAQEFAWIKQFAATTPYQLNEVTQGFVKMKALGIDASQAALTSYGNTASAMGKGLNQMIEAVADASTGEFERLKEFGITTSKQGDQVALTFQGVTTTIGNSSKEITEYLESIGRVEFAGAMEERAKTLDGALSNLADNWDELFRTINQGGFGSAVTNDVKSLNTALQGLNDTMLNSQKAGEGMVMQMANAAGFAVGTAAVGLLNGSANILNSTVNMLTGGFFELNENVKLLPESLMTNEQRTAALTGKLQDAEANLAKLQQQLSAVPDNIYLKDSTYQAYLLVQQLRAAKEAQDKLSNGAQTSQSESRIKASNAYAEQEQKNQQKINDLMTKSSGISDAYIKRAKEIQEANAGGAMTAGQLATALDGLHGMLKKNTAGNAAAKKEASDYAKELDAQADTLAKLSGYNKDYEDQARRLVAMREKGTLTEEGYVRAINELVTTQPGMIALTKAQAEASENSAKADIKAFVAMDDLRLASEKQVTQAATTLAQIEFETALLAMNTEQRAQATMERELERQGIIKGTTAYDAYITKLREAMAIKSGTEAGIKATEDLAKASQKAAEASEKYWEDALMRAFESGKGFFQSLWDTIKNTLKTQVLKVMIQGVGLGGATGAMADSSSGMLSMANTLSNLPTAITSLTSAVTGLWAGATATGAGAMTAAGISAANAASAGLAYSGSVAAGAGSSFLAGSSLSSTLAAIPGWGWAALGVAAVAGLVGSNKFVSAATTGVTSSSYSASGALLSKAGEQGTQAQLDAAYKNADALAKSYFETASKLGIKAIESVFNWGSNSGREGANPNTSITVVAGAKTYRSGEVSNADQAAISTMTAQALFTALQASELPAYLSHVFDSMDAATMTSDQISAVLSYAAGLKTVRDALLETREPLQIVKDSASAAFATLATSAATFKTDFVAAIDAGISPDKITQWQALGAALDTLATEDAAAAKKATEAAAKALKNQTEWQQKLDIATGSATAREIEKTAALLAADDATDILINRLYALEDAAALASRKTAIIDKYTPMTLDGAKSALPAGFADAFAAMGSEAAKQWVSSYTATLTDPASIAQVEKLGAALDVVFASMEASEARLKGFADEAAQLSIELLTTQGNTAGAAKALRELETKGFNAAELAAYEYNKSLRNQITAINDAKAALESFNAAAASIRASQDTIAGTSPIDSAQRELALSLTALNTQMKLRPDRQIDVDAVAGVAGVAGSAAGSFFTVFQDAADYLKNFATEQADAFNGYVNAKNADGNYIREYLVGAALDSPAWANELFDLIKNNGNETIRKMGELWVDPDVFGNVAAVAAVAAVEAKPATTMTVSGGINSAFVPYSEEDARIIGAAIATATATGDTSATKKYTTAQIDAFKVFMNNAATLTTAQNTAATAATAEATKTADAIQAITDGLTKEGKSLNIALLEAQGNMTGAADAAKALATEGMNPLQIGLWEANELVKKQTATLVQHNTLQGELNSLRDTEAQALTRQRNALDESNRALFDQVQGFKTLKSLQSQFAVPQTATQASAAVSAAGYNVTGLDTAGIASYITGILNAPGMLTATGDLTAAGLATVSTLNGLTDSLKILGTEGDKAAEQLKTNAATQAGLQDQLNVLNGTLTQTEVDRANVLAGLTKAGDTASIALQNTVWGLQDLKDAAQITSDYRRATLEASFNNKGLKAFDRALETSARLLAGWTPRQIATLNNLTDSMAGVDTALATLGRATEAEKTSIRTAADAQIKALQTSGESQTKAIKDASETQAKAIKDKNDSAVKALNDQITANNAASEAAGKLASSLSGMVDAIKDASDTLRNKLMGEAWSMVQSRAYVDTALSLARAGAAPDADKLNKALGVITSDTMDNYSTLASYQIAQGVQANKLDELGQLTGRQLSSAEAQVVALESANKLASDQIDALNKASDTQLQALTAASDSQIQAIADTNTSLIQSINDTADAQIKALDQQLLAAQNQVDALKGIDNSVISVKSAVSGLSTAIAGYAGALATLAIANAATTPLVEQAVISTDAKTGKTGWATPSFAVGTNYVPYDMQANIHAGERIIPAADNTLLMQRLNQPSNDNSIKIERLERLLETVVLELSKAREKASETAASTKKLASQFDAVTEGGNAMLTTV